MANSLQEDLVILGERAQKHISAILSSFEGVSIHDIVYEGEIGGLEAPLDISICFLSSEVDKLANLFRKEIMASSIPKTPLNYYHTMLKTFEEFPPSSDTWGNIYFEYDSHNTYPVFGIPGILYTTEVSEAYDKLINRCQERPSELALSAEYDWVLAVLDSLGCPISPNVFRRIIRACSPVPLYQFGLMPNRPNDEVKFYFRHLPANMVIGVLRELDLHELIDPYSCYIEKRAAEVDAFVIDFTYDLLSQRLANRVGVSYAPQLNCIRNDSYIGYYINTWPESGRIDIPKIKQFCRKSIDIDARLGIVLDSMFISHFKACIDTNSIREKIYLGHTRKPFV